MGDAAARTAVAPSILQRAEVPAVLFKVRAPPLCFSAPRTKVPVVNADELHPFERQHSVHLALRVDLRGCRGGGREGRGRQGKRGRGGFCVRVNKVKGHEIEMEGSRKG